MSRLFGWIGEKKPPQGAEQAAHGQAETLTQQIAEAVQRKDYEAAEARCDELIELHKAANHPAEAARAMRAKAEALVRGEMFERARPVFAAAAQLFRSLNLKVEAVAVERDMADLALMCEDLQSARELYAGCLAIYDAQVDRRGAAAVLLRLGVFDLHAGNLDSARERLQRCIEFYRDLENSAEASVALLCISAAVSGGAEFPLAHTLFAESLDRYLKAGGREDLAARLKTLGDTVFPPGNGGPILQLLNLCLPLFYDLCHRRLIMPGSPVINAPDLPEVRTRLAFALYEPHDEARVGPAGSQLMFARLLELGRLAYSIRRYDAGNELFQLALAEARARFDLRSSAMALSLAAAIALHCQHFWMAREYCHELLAAARDIHNIVLCGDALYHTAFMAWQQGELEAARRDCDEALSLYRQCTAPERVAAATTLIGHVKYEAGDKELGPATLKRAIELARAAGAASIAAEAMAHLAYFDARVDEAPARQMAREACEVDGAGPAVKAFANYVLAEIERRSGDSHAAAKLYVACLKYRLEDGDRLGCAFALEGCGLLAAALEMHREAIEWLGKAAALRQELQTAIEPILLKEFELAIAPVRLELGEEQFADAWKNGALSSPAVVIQQVCARLESLG